MTESAPNILRMPDRSERVRDTIRRFEATSDRPSTLLKLSDPDLFEVGLLLSDRGTSIADALRKCNVMLGGSEDEPVVARTSFYAFADRFKALLGQVTAEYAQRIANLTVATATDGNIRDMTRLARTRLVELAAQKLVTTDDSDEVIKDLPKLAMIVSDAEDMQHKADKLDLDRQNFERMLSETQARVSQLEQDQKLKQQRIEERVKALRLQIDKLADRVQRGESIDPSLFTQIREELTGVAA